jgi:mono/diheme cytochrome c family protein
VLNRAASLRRPSVRLIALALACAGGSMAMAACGTQGVSVPKSSPYHAGAVLFAEHCSGCHTLTAVGASGSATNVKDRLRNQGPNFDVRHETVENVLYAIRNGGFSGVIMPQNIVVGEEAEQVAHFLAAYAGTKSQQVPSVEIPPEEPTEGAGASAAPAGGTGATGTTGAPATGGTPASGAGAAAKHGAAHK